MIKDVQAVLGFHNDPSRSVGTFAIKTGAITSAVDRFEFHIKGVGGHAAKPAMQRSSYCVGAID